MNATIFFLYQLMTEEDGSEIYTNPVPNPTPLAPGHEIVVRGPEQHLDVWRVVRIRHEHEELADGSFRSGQSYAYVEPVKAKAE